VFEVQTPKDNLVALLDPKTTCSDPYEQEPVTNPSNPALTGGVIVGKNAGASIASGETSPHPPKKDGREPGDEGGVHEDGSR
jgi:hypothetical protein